jgi:hypothetical protein
LGKVEAYWEITTIFSIMSFMSEEQKHANRESMESQGKDGTFSTDETEPPPPPQPEASHTSLFNETPDTLEQKKDKPSILLKKEDSVIRKERIAKSSYMKKQRSWKPKSALSKTHTAKIPSKPVEDEDDDSVVDMLDLPPECCDGFDINNRRRHDYKKNKMSVPWFQGINLGRCRGRERERES